MNKQVEMNKIVEVQQVTKVYGNKHAVDQVSFTINKGTVVAILGPNGAGKTTTLSMLLGLIDSTSGSVKLFGQDPKEKQVRERVGAMLQEIDVVDNLTVREIIHLVRSYYPNPMTVEELTRLTGLRKEDLNRYANKLSGGQKRSLGFALALAGNPDLLFFDEPTVGLDIRARRAFWDQVQQFTAKGKTIIFTTHYLQEADDVADRVILFHHGSIVADGKPEEIKAKLTKQTVSFYIEDSNNHEQLLALPGVSDVYVQEGRTYVVTTDTDATIAAVYKQNMQVSGVQIQSGSLEDAFAQLTLDHKEVV
ncbi:ABC transporter ATP-binding protein [Paenibacillus sp. N1-5-1-14]|uniref:ABC transporter ATP-binding protein n=1 Tax=Paenibacillus radicibacter TaxID=2972488 RepID=UPI002159A0BF|nr:ABC transporter ATP-binding protein [Paenibacillus radicibacter]MCR8645108.1 ABC transporter ATP-binding protein [Paenibacillus radicibacter]